jgi:hypothetical protein
MNTKYLVVFAVVIMVALGLVLSLRDSNFQNKLNELLDMNIVTWEGKPAGVSQYSVPWEYFREYCSLHPVGEFKEVTSWVTFKSLVKTNKITTTIWYDPNARVIWFTTIDTSRLVTYYYRVPDF